ncbi:DoxX family protein [Paraflavitalea sp. CAU 1676]|uniref:DoxX family protein n=1 Tax=Paraflavitalea sp. CAU 1676 TaxID=3032598 RepID=UPI0023DA6F51|nr:DoxX family protein [Paraflavitalea sp. CAU 1676]MDF2193531.1 DoxX family protein [Paraflavitalea sp. CAU 1676]
MKKNLLIYWIATGVIAGVMVFSIISFTFMEKAIYPDGAFRHLELPAYIKIELTVAKALGLIALLIPGIPPRWKEFAYAGFAITLISASIAHLAIGDPLYNIIDPLVFLAILYVSWLYWHKIKNRPTEAGSAMV